MLIRIGLTTGWIPPSFHANFRIIRGWATRTVHRVAAEWRRPEKLFWSEAGRFSSENLYLAREDWHANVWESGNTLVRDGGPGIRPDRSGSGSGKRGHSLLDAAGYQGPRPAIRSASPDSRPIRQEAPEHPGAGRDHPVGADRCATDPGQRSRKGSGRHDPV